MGVQVNLGELAAVRDKLRTLADAKAIAEQLARRMGAAALKLLADEFNESRDPYGNPWKPVYRRRRKDRLARARRAAKGLPPRADKPLVDTGRLRAAAVAKSADHSSSGAVRIIIPVEYASYHQYGTKRIARRQIVPEADTGGLGPIWTVTLNKEAERVMAEYAAKGGK